MKKIIRFLPLFLFLFLTIFLFRQYVFLGKVPFAGNLLVSLYEPWKSYPAKNYPNGPANKPIGFDSLRIFYPLRSLTTENLKKFKLPLWNPYDFAGNTHLATYQSAVFFPLTPLFLFLPQIDAWSLIVFLQPFLASVFMYYFLRSLALSKKACTLGALAFGFSGGIVVLSEESFMAAYSLLVLPIILLGVYKFFRTKKFMWFGLFVFGALSSVLSGWFQSTLYVMLLSFIWIIFLGIQTKQWKQFLLLLIGICISFLLAGPHVIPNIESYTYSARGTTDAKFLFDLYLLPIWHLITYIAPDFFGNPGTYTYFDSGFYYEKILYIGIPGLVLGLISFFTIKKTAEEWFFTLCWIITVSLGLALPTSWFFLYTLHLPLVSTILPSRIFLISAFCLSVLASYGFEHMEKKMSKMSLAVVVICFGLILFYSWHFLLQQKITLPTGNFATISYRNFFLPTLLTIVTILICFLFILKKKLSKNLGFATLVCISLISIVYFSDKYLYFSERQFTFPNSPVTLQLQKIAGDNRIWSFGEGYMERNFATEYHLESPEGYDSFYIRTYGELVEASKNGGTFTTNIPRADAQLQGVGNLSEIAKNSRLLTMLNLLGVKYLFAKASSQDEAFVVQDPRQIFRIVWTDKIYTIYENILAFPRVFFVPSFIVRADPKKQLQTIFNPSINLSQVAILDATPHLPIKITNFLGKATIVQYNPEKVVIQTDQNMDSLLILSDNIYPGWNAYINGKKTKLFTADHTFRAVVSPGGRHKITFLYQPESVTIGFISFVIGLLLFVIAGFTIKKINKNT